MAPEQVQGDEAQHEADMEVHAPAVGPDELGKEGHGDGRRNGLPHDPGCIGPSPFLFGEPVFDKDTLQGIVRGCPACFLILKGVVISSHETNRFS